MERTKRSRRKREYVDSNGDIWDSQFEWQVYVGLRDLGYDVRRCDQRDTVAYRVPIQAGRCLECGGAKTVQERTYTSDLYVNEAGTWSGRRSDGSGGYFIECKGFIRKSDRDILINVAKAEPSINVRVIFQRDFQATPRRRAVAYMSEYVKLPAALWNKGAFEWAFPKEKK